MIYTKESLQKYRKEYDAKTKEMEARKEKLSDKLDEIYASNGKNFTELSQTNEYKEWQSLILNGVMRKWEEGENLSKMEKMMELKELKGEKNPVVDSESKELKELEIKNIESLIVKTKEIQSNPEKSEQIFSEITKEKSNKINVKLEPDPKEKFNTKEKIIQEKPKIETKEKTDLSKIVEKRIKEIRKKKEKERKEKQRAEKNEKILMR